MSRLVMGTIACLVACAHGPDTAAGPAPIADRKTREPTAPEKAWFDELKSAIGAEWISRIEGVVESNDPDGCKDFAVERRLVVEFVVKADGVFESARVRESSGLPYLDKQGPETFFAVKRVAPPPPSFVGKRLPFAFNVNARSSPETCKRR